MGGTRVDLEDCALDQLRGHKRGGSDRNDMVIVAVEHEGGNIEPLQIVCEIGFGERLVAIQDTLVAGNHALVPKGNAAGLLIPSRQDDLRRKTAEPTP